MRGFKDIAQTRSVLLNCKIDTECYLCQCKGKNIMAKMEEGTEVLNDRRTKYQAEKEQAPGAKSDELPANNSKPGRSRRGSNFIGTHGNLVGTRDAHGNIIR